MASYYRNGSTWRRFHNTFDMDASLRRKSNGFQSNYCESPSMRIRGKFEIIIAWNLQHRWIRNKSKWRNWTPFICYSEPKQLNHSTVRMSDWTICTKVHSSLKWNKTMQLSQGLERFIDWWPIAVWYMNDLMEIDYNSLPELENAATETMRETVLANTLNWLRTSGGHRTSESDCSGGVSWSNKLGFAAGSADIENGTIQAFSSIGNDASEIAKWWPKWAICERWEWVLGCIESGIVISWNEVDREFANASFTNNCNHKIELAWVAVLWFSFSQLIPSDLPHEIHFQLMPSFSFLTIWIPHQRELLTPTPKISCWYKNKNLNQTSFIVSLLNQPFNRVIISFFFDFIHCVTHWGVIFARSEYPAATTARSRSSLRRSALI
jgi:hypothetical protein